MTRKWQRARVWALALGVCSCREAGTSGSTGNVCDCGAAASSSSASSADAAGPGTTLVDRARGGDSDALKQMELVRAADRSTNDCLAIAAGHAALSREAFRTFAKQLGEKPELLDDRNVVAKLFHDASDPDTAPLALPVVATIAKPLGPDMLYEIWKHGAHPPTKSLAEDLLLTNPVRKNASPELEFALALELEGRCPKLRELMEKAEEAVDVRSLPRLKELENETGCGPKKKDDCFPCLRGDSVIATVRDAANKKKKLERPWEIRRR